MSLYFLLYLIRQYRAMIFFCENIHHGVRSSDCFPSLEVQFSTKNQKHCVTYSLSVSPFLWEKGMVCLFQMFSSWKQTPYRKITVLISPLRRSHILYLPWCTITCHDTEHACNKGDAIKIAFFFHSRHAHRGLVASLPGENDFIHLDGGRSGAIGRDAYQPGHFSGCPGRGVPWTCFHRSSGYRRSASKLCCGLEHPIWLVWRGGVCVQVSTSSGSHRDSSSTLRDLETAGDPRDAFLFLPPSPSWEATFLVRCGAEESTRAVAPLTGCLATTRTYAAPNSA
jgi:hypothetical protein